jgi:hypothetical protein
MASSFLLCCVLAATVAIASAGEVSRDVYKINGKPVRGMDLMAETDGHELADAWADLYEVPEPDTSEPEKFLEWLERTKETVRENVKADAQRYNEPDKIFDTLNDMIEVANADGYCSHSQMRAFLLANKVQNNFRSLANYLNHYMPQKLANCAEKARNTFPPKSDGFHSYERTLDDFYSRILGQGASDEELYNALRNTDLLNDEVNFAAGLEIAQENTDVEAGPDHERIYLFLLEKCNNLRFYDADQLDAILLSDAIAPVEESPRIQKLIEYDHTCYYLRKNSDRFQENVQRQL